MNLKDCKVGMRVAVYGTSQVGIGQWDDLGRSFGTIHQLFSDHWLNVKLDSGRILTFHCKQLRRLKPKQRRVPREWTLYEHPNERITTYMYSYMSELGTNKGPGKPIRVREILE